MRTVCPKCNGSGKFIPTYGSRKGQELGICFYCKGAGGFEQEERKHQPQKSYNFPRLIRLLHEHNVKLKFDDCKIAVTSDGRIVLVAPIFGQGIFGRFQSDGTFFPTKSCTEKMLKQLQEVEEKGMDAVKEYSKMFGFCCMCGRTLTNENSIEAGIGPICGGKSF